VTDEEVLLLPTPDEEIRWCSTCRGSYGISFFSRFNDPMQGRRWSSRCNYCMCRTSKRWNRRRVIRVKAKTTIESHKRRFGSDIHLYGWRLNQIEADIKKKLGSRCPECERLMSLNVISLDIIDPTMPPEYSTNVRIICLQCNAQKGSKTPEEWLRFRYWTAKARRQMKHRLFTDDSSTSWVA
jgi:hypothetical protein